MSPQNNILKSTNQVMARLKKFEKDKFTGVSLNVILVYIFQPKDTGFTKMMAAISKCANQTVQEKLFHK